MNLARTLVAVGTAVLALWAVGVAVEQGASQGVAAGSNLLALIGSPIPTLRPLAPLQVPERDVFALDRTESTELANQGAPRGPRGVGSIVVPDPAGALGGGPAIVLLATGVDVDKDEAYALVREGNDGGRIVHVGDALGGVGVVAIHPRLIDLADGTTIAMGSAPGSAGSSAPNGTAPGGAAALPVLSRPAGSEVGAAGEVLPNPMPTSAPTIAPVPLNGTVNSVTVDPGSNVGTNPGSFSSVTGIPSGSLAPPPAVLLPGASTTGLGTSSGYQGLDSFGPGPASTPGSVNPGGVR